MALEASVKESMAYKLQDMKPQMDEAAAWITAVTGVAQEGDFGEWLKSGAVLCQLLNAVAPGSVKKINAGTLPFKQMENISMFLRNVKKLGIHECDAFDTNDLFMGNDLAKVVQTIHAFGGVCQTKLHWTGPQLGVKLAAKNVRTFDENKLAEARSAVSRLSMGSSNTMERTHLTKQGITVGNDASGAGNTGAVTKTMVGSGATMQRTHITRQGITAGHEASGAGEVGGYTKLMHGSRTTMERSHVAKQGITVGNEAVESGVSEPTKLMTASGATMERTHIAKQGITTGHDHGTTFGNDMAKRNQRPPVQKLW